LAGWDRNVPDTPASPQVRRAALPGSPDHETNFIEPIEITETTAAVQPRSLRQRYSIGYCVPLAISPLILGLPR
jgi:hypothetical protein